MKLEYDYRQPESRILLVERDSKVCGNHTWSGQQIRLRNYALTAGRTLACPSRLAVTAMRGLVTGYVCALSPTLKSNFDLESPVI